jgi:hypothetical protein
MAVVYGFTGRRGQTGTGFCMVFLLRGSITDTGLFDWKDFDNILDIYKSAEPALLKNTISIEPPRAHCIIQRCPK